MKALIVALVIIGSLATTDIAAQWIRNYVEYDYRSLGSYTRADLDRIAAGPDAF